MTAEPAVPGPDTGPYEVIHLRWDRNTAERGRDLILRT